MIIYTGKGGVGKSVVSAATGVKLADLGYNVVVLSSDPAHTIFSCLNMKVTSDIVKVIDGLYITAVDPISEMRAKFDAISNFIIEWFKGRGLDEVLAYELAMLPAMTEAIGLLKILDYYEEGYDVIIVDTVPSGDALRLLYLPRITTSIYKRMLKIGSMVFNGVNKALAIILGTKTSIGEMLREEKMLFEYLEKLAGILENSQITSVRVIANPDSMSVESAIRATSTAQIFNLNVDLGIFNKVMPESIANNHFKGWIQKQRQLFKEFKTSLYPIPIRKAPLLKSEIKGLNMLRNLADTIYGDDDPLKIYYVGKPVEIKKVDDGVDLIIQLPFNVQDCTDIISLKDEIIVELKTDVGMVEKILPLPTMLHLMKPINADFEKGKLTIHFKHVEI